MNQRPAKPLWGFGWAGWALALIALSLLIAMVSGVDIRFRILSGITSVLGIKATYWFVVSFIINHALFDFPFLPAWPGAWSTAPPAMRFSLITMCLTLIAGQVHPRRVGLVRTAAIVAMGVVVPALTMDCATWVAKAYGGTQSGSSFPYVSGMTTFSAAWAVFSAAGIGWFTRSWRMGLLAAAFSSVGSWLFIEAFRGTSRTGPLLISMNGTESWYLWLSWAWNPMLFACLMYWAIKARLRVFPEYACQHCGYDLRGTPESVCPECGMTVAHVPSPTPLVA